MLIGYRRISPSDQTLDLQTEALNQAGCDRIFTDITAEPGVEQPELLRRSPIHTPVMF